MDQQQRWDTCFNTQSNFKTKPNTLKEVINHPPDRWMIQPSASSSQRTGRSDVSQVHTLTDRQGGRGQKKKEAEAKIGADGWSSAAFGYWDPLPGVPYNVPIYQPADSCNAPVLPVRRSLIR